MWLCRTLGKQVKSWQWQTLCPQTNCRALLGHATSATFLKVTTPALLLWVTRIPWGHSFLPDLACGGDLDKPLSPLNLKSSASYMMGLPQHWSWE